MKLYYSLLAIAWLLFLSVVLTPPSFALDYDKKLHLGAGALIGAGSDMLLYHTAKDLSVSGRCLASTGASLGAGLAKEGFDLLFGGTPEWADVLYTLGGGALGTGLSEVGNGMFFVSASGDQVSLVWLGRY